MSHPFDALTEQQLRQRSCIKWGHYPPDVLPLWVADMDFPIASEIKDALREHVAGDEFGYPPMTGVPGLLDAVQERLADRYGYRVPQERITQLPGIIPGLYLAVRTLAGPADEVIVQPPAYPPFMQATNQSHRKLVYNPMVVRAGRWELDLEGLERMITPATRLLIFCNPQNPTGRVFTRAELERLAEIVLEHRLWVVSDELHADLTLDARHIPFASLSPEVAERTVTLYGPTKAFNIAGLKVGFMIAGSDALNERLRAAGTMLPPPNVLAQVATLAAYRHADGWLESTLDYLRGNREVVARFVEQELPGVEFIPPEGTYLAWLDFRRVVPADELEGFLLDRAKVGLNLGAGYGPGGEGHARLNFATSRSLVTRCLERVRDALTTVA